jgi:hypothetical protein
VAGLRWILLGAGVALILGLWWWETRKSHARPAGPLAGADSGGGVVSAEGEADSAPAYDEETAEPPYAPTIERVRVPRRPPLIEIPDDLEVDVSDFVGIDRRRGAEPEFSLEPDPGPDAEPEGVGDGESVYPDDDGIQDDHHRAPWVSTQPLERDEVAPRREEEPPEAPPSDPMRREATGTGRRCAPRWKPRTCILVRIRSFIGSARTASRSCTSRA